MTPDDDSETHHIYDGKMKLQDLVDFIEPFALKADQKKEERVIDSKTQTTINQQKDPSGYMHFSTVNDIED